MTIDGHRTQAVVNHLIVVPKDAEHIADKNVGAARIFPVCAPPAEPQGAQYRINAEVENAEHSFVARAAQTVGDVGARHGPRS